jgi:hypothetical protein
MVSGVGGGVLWGALWGQDRYQAALRGVRAPVGARPWPATLLDLQERGDASNYGQRAVTQKAEERAPTRRYGQLRAGTQAGQGWCRSRSSAAVVSGGQGYGSLA